MSECDKSALELAESSEWGALHRLVSAHPVRAEELDDFGMMPLHWACTDTNVPLRAVKVLLDAYPLAAVLKNKGGLVPLHIAVKANAKTDVLRALVAVRDDALCLETPAGETPADLARACRLAHDKVTLLTHAEEHLRASGRAPPRASDRYKSLLQPLEPHHHLMDAENVPPSNGIIDSRRGSSASLASDSSWVLTGTNSNSLGSTGGGMSSVGMLRSTSALLTAVPLPPRWRLDSRCNICQVKFTYFKNRHHCRSCGESVCSTHSNRRMALKHIGLSTPQRVCILCYDEMREHGKPASAVVNMYATRKEPMSTSAKTPSSSSGKRTKDAFDATPPRHGPLLRPTRSVLSLTASASAVSASATSLDPTITPVTYTSDSDDSDSDFNTRPRAWTEMDASENLLTLQHHARELQQSKRALEQQIARGAQAIAHAQHEKLVHERTVADLRVGRMLDISRVPPDSDAIDADASLLEAEQDAVVDAALTCNHLGMALFEKGEFASAILELRRSVALNARDPDVWYNLARALHGAGELQEAEGAVQRALDLVGRSYALLALLGKILHAQGEDDKSIDVFREALGLMDHGDDGDSDSDDHDVGSATVGW